MPTNYYYYYYNYYYLILLWVFHTIVSWWFEWQQISTHLQDSSQYSWLNNAVVWMVSTRPLISKSSSSCCNPLVTLPSAPIIIGITVSFMFYSFFSSLARSTYLSLFFTFFHFYPVVSRNGKVHYSAGSPFFFFFFLFFFFFFVDYH